MWKFRRLLFFFNQRCFSVLSFLLLDNAVCGKLRGGLLRILGARIGQGCFIRGGLHIQESFNFEIGDGVFINSGCWLDGSQKIVIGNRVQFGFQVTLITGDHEIGSAERRVGEHAARPIVIEDGAWIGAKSVILSGVTVGAGSIVAAGSVVAMNVPENALVAGNPARVVKKLSPTAQTSD